MSSYICEFYVHSALAAYAVANGVWRADYVAREPSERNLGDAELLAKRLHAANVKSVTERYPHKLGMAGPAFEFDGRYSRAARAGTFSPVQIIKAAQCLAYQSSDASTWDESPEAGILEAIIKHAITQLDGYETAAWGLPELPRPFYVETRADGFPWTREGVNARADGRFIPYESRAAAELAIGAFRCPGPSSDPMFARADYRVVPA